MLKYLTLCLLIVFLILLINLVVIWRRQQRQLDKVKNMPGPLSLPFLGSSYKFFGSDLSEFYKKMYDMKREYGKTMKLSIGNHLLIIISAPEALERVIGNKNLVDRIEIAKLILRDTFRDGILINSGETWKLHRKLLSSLFHNNYFEKIVENLSKNSAILADNLSKIPRETTFDTYSYGLLCTIDSIVETIIGAKSNLQLTMNTEFVEYYGNVINSIGKRIASPFLTVDLIYRKTNLYKSTKKGIDIVYGYVQNLINERKEEYRKAERNGKTSKTKYLFDVLFENGEVTDEEILEEGFNMLTAGSETSATVFSFVLVALGEYQDVQEKVMEEQRSIFCNDINRPVTYEDVQNMVYLEQVVKEVMRLYPPVSFLYRTATEVVDLGDGLFAPKGSSVVAFIYDTHNDPTLYPDPDRFDPDRFSPENSYGRHPYAYIPFGAGRRFCIGFKYAMVELKTMLSVVLRRLKIVRAIDGLEEMKKHLEFSMVVRSGIGYKIHIEPR